MTRNNDKNYGGHLYLYFSGKMFEETLNTFLLRNKNCMPNIIQLQNKRNGSF